jgi:SAM-dependent methyltransferase
MSLGNRISGKPCPICHHEATTTPEDGEYIRCGRCGVLQTRFDYNPKIYGTNYAENYVEYSQTDVNTPLNLFRLGLVSRWLKPQNRILDIGCCIGEFIRFAEHYYNCVGLEPNNVARKIASKRVQSIVASDLDGTMPVHCITLFDVLEHIQEPQVFLHALVREYLHPRGIVVITTPNVEVIPAWNDDLLRRWKHYKPQEHLFLYTEDSLAELCKRVGLEPIHWGREESDIRPGNPDGDILTCVARKAG